MSPTNCSHFFCFIFVPNSSWAIFMRGLCYLLLPLHYLEITKLKFDFCGPWNIHRPLKWIASCILVGTFKMNKNEILFLPWSSWSSHILRDSCISFDLRWRVTRAFEITKCTANWKIITNQKQLNVTKKVFVSTLEFYFHYHHLAIFFTGHCFQTIQGRSFRCCSYTSEQGMLVKLKEICYFPMFTTCKSNG